ncbi:MAG: hypothetical protein WD071_06805 [Pseudohongiella sp.]|uniref:hypothetical protein n=1 Tax=Pseudohongiella sp. TaxID=1979412 RepID=UPI0034A0278D
MNIYVIVTRGMGGSHDEAVFSSRSLAQQYLSQRDSQGDPNIVDIEVRGNIEEPNKVFTASWYERASDIHHFDGVYGSFEGAKKAAGEKGLVLGRVLDERIG